MIPEGEDFAHASCVAIDAVAALIVGPSGAGKSHLALEMMGLGAELVADDRVVLRNVGGAVVASAPKALEGLIEARGIGLLETAFARSARVCVIVDLDASEPDRLPPDRRRELLGISLPVIFAKGAVNAAALGVLLRAGGVRKAP